MHTTVHDFVFVPLNVLLLLTFLRYAGDAGYADQRAAEAAQLKITE
jgi:hypothetical protein